jgi:hypothetical protein
MERNTEHHMTTNYAAEYARYEHRWYDLFGDVQEAKYGLCTVVGVNEYIVLHKLTKVQFVMMASLADRIAADAACAELQVPAEIKDFFSILFIKDVQLLRTTGRMVDDTEAAQMHQITIEETENATQAV